VVIIIGQNSSTCIEKKQCGDVARKKMLKDADRVEVGLSRNLVTT
jgi:hypothetical protein